MGSPCCSSLPRKPWASEWCARGCPDWSLWECNRFVCCAPFSPLVNGPGLWPKVPASSTCYDPSLSIFGPGIEKVRCSWFWFKTEDACFASQSVVGHVSRIARRVSSRTVSLRVLERVLIRTKALIRKRKGNLSSRLRAYCRRARRMNAWAGKWKLTERDKTRKFTENPENPSKMKNIEISRTWSSRYGLCQGQSMDDLGSLKIIKDH